MNLVPRGDDQSRFLRIQNKKPIFTNMSVFTRIHSFLVKNKTNCVADPVNFESKWQDQFSGIWETTERKNFYEYVIFYGVPVFIANLKKGALENGSKAESGEVFEFQDSDGAMRIIATGIPKSTTPWIDIADSKDSAIMTIGKDGNGRAYKMSFWFDNETKVHNAYIEYNDGNTAFQTRKITEDGSLYLHSTFYKPDGSSCWYDNTFKRVKHVIASPEQ